MQQEQLEQQQQEQHHQEKQLSEPSVLESLCLIEDLIYPVFDYLDLCELLQCRLVSIRLHNCVEHHIRRYGATLKVINIFNTYRHFDDTCRMPIESYIKAIFRRWGTFVKRVVIEPVFMSEPTEICMRDEALNCLKHLKGVTYNITFPSNMFWLNLETLQRFELTLASAYRDDQLEPHLLQCRDTLQSLTLQHTKYSGTCLRFLKNLTTLKLANARRINFEQLLNCVARNQKLERFEYCISQSFLNIPVDRLCLQLQNLSRLSIGPIAPTQKNISGLDSLLTHLTELTVRFTDTDNVVEINEINKLLKNIACHNLIESLGLVMPRKYRLAVDTLRSFAKFTSLKVLGLEKIWNFYDFIKIAQIVENNIKMFELNFEELSAAQFVKDICRHRPKYFILVRLMDTVTTRSQIELNYFPINKLMALQAIIDDCFPEKSWLMDSVTFEVIICFTKGTFG